MLRNLFSSHIKFNWTFGLALILIVTTIRFYIVLKANITQDYGNAAIIFIFMAALPFILLNKDGRKYIGITKPKNYSWLFLAFILGIFICSITFLTFKAFYGYTVSNSMVYISQSYVVDDLNSDNKLIYFAIFAISSMIYSPIGEELFYRGLIHGCFVDKFGENNASRLDSLAFSIAHLSHFGIIYYLGKWNFLLFPTLLWMLSMYILSRVFFICKQKSGSILGPIFSHAGFNFAMIYWIFYDIL